MPVINKEAIQHVAHLARIKLEVEELDKLSGQLSQILDFIDQLNKVDISQIAPTSHILPIQNVLRQDQLQKSLPNSLALMNAPCPQGMFFGVPKVIE